MASGRPIRVGKWTYGAETIKILQWNPSAKISIGAFCSISTDVTALLGCNHDSSLVSTYPFPPDKFGYAKQNPHNLSKGGIVIGNDVWIGKGVTLLDGSKIEDGVIVGANSLVTRNLPPFTICGGNPARVIRKRFDDEIEKIICHVTWWDLDDDAINRLLPFLQSVPTLSQARMLYRAFILELGSASN